MTDRPKLIETDVLIVGAGPSGAAASLALATYGISTICISRYGSTSPTPRGHITNQRTMEFLRHFDLEGQATAIATPQALMGEQVYCTSLAGFEFGRIKTWHTQPRIKAEHDLISPCSIADLTQDLLEPIIVAAAMREGSRVRFETELVKLEQDEEGVTSTVVDLLSGVTYQIRSKYVVGADGANSTVAKQIDLPLTGPSNVAGNIGFLFDADLSKFVEYRPGVLYWIIQPGRGVGGFPIGGLRMVRAWGRWIVTWGYDVTAGPPQISNEDAVAIIHRIIGDDTVAVELRGIYLWSMNRVQAEEYSKGRVYCVGDAVHRHPPMNGLGTNTSIQDSFNLAWKLAYVIKGRAGSKLLNSYEPERKPVGHDLVRRAFDNFGLYKPVAEALGFTRGEQPALLFDTLADRLAEPSAEGEQRRSALRKAIADNVIGFSALGGEHNQFYSSPAIIEDERHLTVDNVELEVVFGAQSGRRLPHVWLTKHQHRVSSLDACKPGRFTLLTGVLGAKPWSDAVAEATKGRDIPLDVVTVGQGQLFQDPYGEFATLCLPNEDGAVLVRPDLYLAWRVPSRPDQPAAALADALSQILDLE